MQARCVYPAYFHALRTRNSSQQEWLRTLSSFASILLSWECGHTLPWWLQPTFAVAVLSGCKLCQPSLPDSELRITTVVEGSIGNISTGGRDGRNILATPATWMKLREPLLTVVSWQW